MSEDKISTKAGAGATPTFSRDIAPMFTQYDVIQMSYAFDLRSYQDVKTHADAIYRVVQENPENPGQSLLPGIPVMPLYEAQWTPERVQTFKAWMDAGYPPGEQPAPPPPISEVLPLFITLSEVLTGLDGLDANQELAQTYLDRLVAESAHGAAMDSLLAAWKEVAGQTEPARATAVEERILGDSGLGALAKEIVLVWYNATINGAFGTPENNQYTQALVWPTASCHPMGWATENVPFYWQYQPEGMTYTGLRPATPPQSQQDTNNSSEGGGHHG